MKVGRHSKMTDPRVLVVMDALKGGNTRTAAASYAQIDHATFYRWMEADATFRDAVTLAEATAEIRAMAIIIRSAQGGDAQSAKWWMEKRRRRDYGVQALEITGLDGGPIRTEEVSLSDHERIALRKAIDAELAKEPVA